MPELPFNANRKVFNAPASSQTFFTAYLLLRAATCLHRTDRLLECDDGYLRVPPRMVQETSFATFQNLFRNQTEIMLPPMQTSRLILRDWKDEDIPVFAAISQDPQVMEFFPAVLTYEETINLVKRFQEHSSQHGFGAFAVELRDTGEFIGFISLLTRSFEAPFTPCVEIGWRIASQHWNKGYATEAAKRVLRAGFEQYRFKEIISFTAAINKRSMRVMEKIGMKRDIHGDFYHPKLPANHPLARHVLFRLTAEEFEAAKPLLHPKGKARG